MRTSSNSSDPKILQRIALIALVVFVGVITYAIHKTSETVAQVEADHYEISEEVEE